MASVTPEFLAANISGLSNVAPLNAGGQKIVFRAQHTDFGSVVVKLITTAQEDDRLQREIAAVQAINSKHVPKILEQGRINIDGDITRWLIEQRVDGVNVRQFMSAQGPLSTKEAILLGLHILEALEVAEQRKIVHRDVKPENIMRDMFGNYWLLDFGLARLLNQESLTPTLGFGFGTPGYAPPEQYRNKKTEIDSRTDLFALGATLYTCLTGSNPYLVNSRDIGEIIRRVEQTVPPVLKIPDCPLLGQFVSTLMKLRLDHRPSSVLDALTWLREIEAQRSKNEATTP